MLAASCPSARSCVLRRWHAVKSPRRPPAPPPMPSFTLAGTRWCCPSTTAAWAACSPSAPGYRVAGTRCTWWWVSLWTSPTLRAGEMITGMGLMLAMNGWTASAAPVLPGAALVPTQPSSWRCARLQHPQPCRPACPFTPAGATRWGRTRSACGGTSRTASAARCGSWRSGRRGMWTRWVGTCGVAEVAGGGWLGWRKWELA